MEETTDSDSPDPDSDGTGRDRTDRRSDDATSPDTADPDSDAPDRPTRTASDPAPDGRSNDENEREADRAPDDSSLGASIAIYVVRLAVTFLSMGARIVYSGGKIAIGYLGDAGSRRRSRRWILLEGDRGVIVAGFVAAIFATSLVLGVSDVIGVRESRFVTTMFSTMIAGLFSFIPIVVSVNQLIISRLFGTPDRLTDRIDGVREFRARVESKTDGDGVSPTDPAPFLVRLAGTLGDRAESLVTVCEADDGFDDESSTALAAVCRYASRTNEHAEELSSRLTGEVESVFDVVSPTMDHDYSGAANEARRLRNRFEADLSDRKSALLSELQELFVTVDATRQYFTTIYLQQELARLSRLITYSGTAALLLSTLVIMIYASGYPPVAHEGPLLVLVSIALAVAFSPLAVLFAYVIRIATILRLTSAPGEFTPPGDRPPYE